MRAKIRRAKELLAEGERDKKREAALKGWNTRFMKNVYKVWGERTEREQATHKMRSAEGDLNFDPRGDHVRFGTDEVTATKLAGILYDWSRRGITDVSFTRQVPPRPEYPTGVVSTPWINLAARSYDQIRQMVGGMMHPGQDFLSYFVVSTLDVAKLPKQYRRPIQRWIKDNDK
jgi:hypothetical protein